MKNLIFIAPPASGKGTQSNLLANKYNYEHISTGDLLRKEIDLKTKLGLIIKDNLSKGEQVSDNIISKILENRLTSIKKSFILDGYPRNITQVKILEKMLKRLNKKIEIIIYLNVSKAEASNRALNRLICPICNKTYQKNTDIVKPKVEGMCDICNIALVKRTDDTKETFNLRYQNFIEKTKPLLDYYQNKGMLHIINKTKTPSETFSEIEKVIK